MLEATPGIGPNPPAPPGTVVPPPPPPPLAAPPFLMLPVGEVPDPHVNDVVLRVGGDYPQEVNRTYWLDPAGKSTVRVNTVAIAGTLDIPAPPDDYPPFANRYSLGLSCLLTATGTTPAATPPIIDFLHDETAFPYFTLDYVFTAATPGWVFLFYVRYDTFLPRVRNIPRGTYSVNLLVQLHDLVGVLRHSRSYNLNTNMTIIDTTRPA